MPRTFALDVKVGGVGTVDILHYQGEIPKRSLNHKVIVIGHQAVSVYYRSVSCARGRKVEEKLFTVSRTFENIISLIASGGDMIEGSRVFYPQRPGHVFTSLITAVLYNT